MHAIHTNGDVDMVSRAHDDGSNDQSSLAYGSHPLAAEEIGHGTHERTEGSVRNEISDDQPEPSTSGAANLAVDVGKNAAEEIQRYLRTHPEE